MCVDKFSLRFAVVAGFIAWSTSVFAQEVPAQTSAPVVSETPTSGDTAAAVGHHGNDSTARQQATPLDAAAATQAWLDSVPREKREKSDAYFEGGYWLLLGHYGCCRFLFCSTLHRSGVHRAAFQYV